MKWLKKIINRLFKTRLTATQFHLLREIYRRRNCAQCNFLVAYINWWCSNNDACKMRDTDIAGGCHCPYWKPNRESIKTKLRRLENIKMKKRIKSGVTK